MADDEPKNKSLARSDPPGKLVWSSSALIRRGLELADFIVGRPGNQIVLIVEWDNLMSMLFWYLFSEISHAHRAKSLPDARRYFSEHHSEIFAVIGQLGQPEMSMLEFMNWCHRLNPNVWGIVSCDNKPTPSLTSWLAANARGRFLQLPFQFDRFVETCVSIGFDSKQITTEAQGKDSFWTHQERPYVLIVTDNAHKGEFLANSVVENCKFEFRCLQPRSAAEALDNYLEYKEDVAFAIVLEFSDPSSGNACELVSWMRAEDRYLPILVLSTVPLLDWPTRHFDALMDEIRIDSSWQQIRDSLDWLGCRVWR